MGMGVAADCLIPIESNGPSPYSLLCLLIGRKKITVWYRPMNPKFHRPKRKTQKPYRWTRRKIWCRKVSETSNAAKSDKRFVVIGQGENMEGVPVDDLNEPTMSEKLASLNIVDDGKVTHGNEEREKSTRLRKPPCADSVNIWLKQALHADDRALILDCLYTLDEKVIENSVSLLNPSDVLILLHFLVSLIQSRGAVLACALPWLKSLLHQHASGIVSQELSLHALNSLNQLIESRVSTFESALQVSSCLDFLYAGIVEDEEEKATIPLIYEDKDESDEEESEDAMDTDQDSEEGEGLDEAFDGVSACEGIIKDMIDW